MGKRQSNRKPNNKSERNNFQDRSEEREYDKGFRAGSKGRGNKKDPKYKGDDMINNVSWYTPNQTLLSNVATLPFGRITGLPLYDTGMFQSSGSVTMPNSFVGVPGILSMQILPVFGPKYGQLSTSPLNVSAQSLFSYVRHANSGAANYESNDLMLYVLSVANVISYYSFLVRVYGVAANFSVMNKYTPDALLTSMGVNPNDVRANYANLRAAINLLAYRLQSLVIPKGIDYVDRQVFLFENVYTDADNSKAQYYIFNPIGFYVYQEGTSTSPGGSLVFSPLVKSGPTTSSANLLTVDELVAYANDLLNPILGSTDFNEIIAGDILKAFGAENTYSVPSISDDYQVVPQYNKEVLSQIENSVIYDGSVATLLNEDYALDHMPTLSQVTQINSSTLEYTAELPLWGGYNDSPNGNAWREALYRRVVYNDYMINMHEANVSPEMVMVASRLISGDVSFAEQITIGSQKEDLFVVNLCGTEIVYNGAIYYYNQTSANQVPNLQVLSISSVEWGILRTSGAITGGILITTAQVNDSVNAAIELMTKQAFMSKFDWAPRVRAVYGYVSDSGASYRSSDVVWDLDNFTTLSADQMNDIHNIAITGLFNCKTMGAYTPK